MTVDHSPADSLATCYVSELGPMRGERILASPYRARVTAPTHGGTIASTDVLVVAASDGYLCVRQDVGEDHPWYAWVPSELVVPD